MVRWRTFRCRVGQLPVVYRRSSPSPRFGSSATGWSARERCSPARSRSPSAASRRQRLGIVVCAARPDGFSFGSARAERADQRSTAGQLPGHDQPDPTASAGGLRHAFWRAPGGFRSGPVDPPPAPVAPAVCRSRLVRDERTKRPSSGEGQARACSRRASTRRATAPQPFLRVTFRARRRPPQRCQRVRQPAPSPEPAEPTSWLERGKGT